MKRLIVLIVCFSITLSMFVFPAQAAEISDQSFVDMFEMVQVARGWDLNNNVNHYKKFTFPFYSYPVYYVDLVFLDVGGNLDGTDWALSMQNENESMRLTILPLGNDYYRAYGKFHHVNKTAYIQLVLTCFDGPVSGFIDILSFRYSEMPMSVWDIEAYCDITSFGYNSLIHYIPTDEVNHRMFNGGANYEDPYLSLNIWCEDWKKYDYIDYVISMSCYSVTSISCTFDGHPVPFTCSITDNSNSGQKSFNLVIRVDCRTLDRTKIYGDQVEVVGPLVLVSGQTLPEEINYVAMVSVVGSIGLDKEENTYSIFRVIRSYVMNIYNFLVKGSSDADHMGDNVQDKDEQLDDMVDDMNSVTRPPMDSLDGDVSDYVSSDDLMLASAAIDGLFESNIISSIFSMSLILCLASFVFFGKK